MSGKSRIILYDLLIVSTLDVILNLILVPAKSIFGVNNSLGINGASIATATSIIIFNTLFLIQAKYYTTIVPIKIDSFKIFFAALSSSLVLITLRNIVPVTLLSFILLTMSFLLMYILFLFLFKAFDKNDLMIFETFKKKINSYRE